MASLDEVDFTVFRLQKLAHGRHWSDGREVAHNERIVPEWRIRRQLYLNPGFLREFLAYDADLLIVGSYYAPAMQLAMYCQTLRRRPWVFWGESPFVRYSENPMFSSERLRRFLRQAALVPVRVFPAEIWGIGRRAQQTYRGLVRGRIPVRNVPYFANLTRFHDAGALRKPSDRLRFLLCGSLIFRKGTDLVAKAVETLVGEGREFTLEIAGTGSLESVFCRLPERTRARVRLRGFLQLDEIPALYRTTDVLLFPSRHDGWGMSVVEAMAAGMPVISTAQTGSALDLIDDGENGMLLPEPTVELLTQAMRWVLDHRDRLEIMGECARAASMKYGSDVGARTLLDAIHSLTASFGARA